MRSAMRYRLRSLQDTIRKRRVTSDKEVLEIAQLLWSQLDTPLSLGLSLLAKAGQLEDLLRIEFQPGRYLDTDVVLFRDDAQAIAFLRKMPLEIKGIDREVAAWDKFLACEEQCRQTNARFRHLREGASVPPAVSAILHIAQRKISRWLGDLDARSWALRCRFGPGADSSTEGSRVSSYHKLSRLSATADFAEGAAALAASHPSWERCLLRIDPEAEKCEITHLPVDIVPGNKLVFVPKTALVHRSIAVEPRMNIFAQLGLGALLRQRLKRHADLDLDTQEPSQVLAYLGSKYGTIATIDLASASDTISRELVRELLPPQWFTAMDWVRSKSGTYTVNGQTTVLNYEKFSSMGNGFTFELESMIFYALALACAEYCHDDTTCIRCFGDDVAYPVKSVDQLVEVYQFCGFSVNTKKSFSSGAFRESCGADFLNGENVRPVYLKEQLSYAESLFRLANSIRRVAYRRNHGFGCDNRLRPVWVSVIQRLPRSLRDLKGPFRPCNPSRGGWVDVESDDGYIASSQDEAMSSPYVHYALHGIEGWQYASAVATSRYESTTAEGWAVLYAHALYAGRDGNAAEDSPHDPEGNRKVPLRGAGPRRVKPGLLTPGFASIGAWF